MKGDFSKETFDAKKHFHDVQMQQGRVLLDQEWNEQAGINTHRTETGAKDIIGNSGAPANNAGFSIVPVMGSVSPPVISGIQISEGHYYVDGILCENEEDVLFAGQPDYSSATLPTQPGTYIFYLDVWLRHITALEDSSIREVALGGPDTTTRTKTTWQVKYVETNNGASCAAGLPSSITTASTGTMSATAEKSIATDDPCGLTSSGGYRRLQNQLYRVEIHIAGNDRAHASFKWSRDNGSVLVKCEGQEAANKNNLLVTNTGRDDLLDFKSGDWIEVINDDNDLLNTPGVLAQLLPSKGNMLVIDGSTIKDPNNSAANFITIDTAKNTRIRRWDSEADIKLNTNNNAWIQLEDGVEVNFREGTFKTGDYWLIPARTATAKVEWPKDAGDNPLQLLPLGIQHHFAQLAIAKLDAGGWTVLNDCRSLFPPLTELTNLYYVGGDGQEAMPGNVLPNTLKVGVANGKLAVSGAKVKFEILSGGGSLNPNGIVSTDAGGIAECNWTLGSYNMLSPPASLSLQVKASLLDDAGNILSHQLPVIFNAGFSVANNISYESTCTNWAGLPPATVAEALDQLCERKNESGECCSITVGKDGGEFPTLAEAIFKLAEKKTQDVSLCLLPGDHVIEDKINMIERQLKFRTLEITGEAAYITMPAMRLELVAEKIILNGFSFVTNEAKNNKDDPRVILVAGQLIIDHCFFFRFGASPVPFVYIDRFSADDYLKLYEALNKPIDEKVIKQLVDAGCTVYIENSSFIGFFSLVLADGVQGIIEKNTITLLALQSTNLQFDPISILSWTLSDSTGAHPGTKAIIRGLLSQTLNLTAWVLTIKNNHIGEIFTMVAQTPTAGTPNFLPQNVYQSIYVTENIFQLPPATPFINSFCGIWVTITNNQFLYDPKLGGVLAALPPLFIAYVLAFTTVIVGNSSFYGRSIIDVLSSDSKRILGNDPPLNLAIINTSDSE